jgi:hypothetical protein
MRLAAAFQLVPVVPLLDHEALLVEPEERHAGDRRRRAVGVAHHRPVLDGGSVRLDDERLAEANVGAGRLALERPGRVVTRLTRLAERRGPEVGPGRVERSDPGSVVLAPGCGPLVRPASGGV